MNETRLHTNKDQQNVQRGEWKSHYRAEPLSLMWQVDLWAPHWEGVGTTQNLSRKKTFLSRSGKATHTRTFFRQIKICLQVQRMNDSQRQSSPQVKPLLTTNAFTGNVSYHVIFNITWITDDLHWNTTSGSCHTAVLSRFCLQQRTSARVHLS